MRSSKSTVICYITKEQKRERRHLGFSICVLILLNSSRMLCCFRVSSKLFDPNKNLGNRWTIGLRVKNDSNVLSQHEELTKHSVLKQVTCFHWLIIKTNSDFHRSQATFPLSPYHVIWILSIIWNSRIKYSKNVLHSELFQGHAEWCIFVLVYFIYFY